jgi:two-component system chemotaxis response regulator CheB
MLVDDSGIIRRVVTRVLADEPDVEVVGVATNGQEALDRVEVFRPHVVVLDVEMPILDGLQTLRRLRPQWPTLPVIMFSTLTSRGAESTLEALTYGASDYATKPTSLGSLEKTVATMRVELVPLIRSWGEIGRSRQPTVRRRVATPSSVLAPLATTMRPNPVRPVAPTRPSSAPVAPAVALAAAPAVPPARPVPPRPARTNPTGRIDVVVIGSSAGGPNALSELIPQFPGSFPVPILLTQHMPETFTKLLASRLDEKSALKVVEAEPGMIPEPGHLYIAKGGMHLVATRTAGRVVLDFDDGPPENYCRPAVDVMFRSAAEVWGPNLLALILTGMGRDGVDGCSRILEHGGSVITQDEASCLVWGMPGAVVEAGLSGQELPLNRIAAEVGRRVRPVASRTA